MFRTFTRPWYADKACTIPQAGRKTYTGHKFATEAEAREFCRKSNDERGPTRRGERGAATEYEAGE